MRRRAPVAISGLVACASLALGALVHCGSAAEDPNDFDVPLPDRVASADAGADGAADSGRPDAGPDAEAGSPACDKKKPFGAPTHLAGAWVANEHYSTPRLSADELSVYFTTKSAAGDSELGTASRASLVAPFGTPTLMTAQNSTSADNDPSVAADHLALFFHSSRGGNQDLFTATRASTSAPFGAPSVLPTVNGMSDEAHAYFREAANELWFVSNRAAANGPYHVYVSTKTGPTYSAPALVPELSSASNDWQPQPSEDGLTMLLASDRPGGAGGFDLYLATRTSTAKPFGAPAPIVELNTANGDQAGWLSADGCRLYFSSDRDAPGVTSILWVAQRPK